MNKLWVVVQILMVTVIFFLATVNASLAHEIRQWKIFLDYQQETIEYQNKIINDIDWSEYKHFIEVRKAQEDM